MRDVTFRWTDAIDGEAENNSRKEQHLLTNTTENNVVQK